MRLIPYELEVLRRELDVDRFDLADQCRQTFPTTDPAAPGCLQKETD